MEINFFMNCRMYQCYTVYFIVVISLSFLSCGSARIRSLQLTAKETSPEMFVQKRNMEIIPVSSFKNYKYDRDSLIALQDDRAFRRLDDDKEYIRLIKGPMNLYYLYTHYTTTSFHGPSAANPSGVSLDQRTRITRYFDLGVDQPLTYFDRESIGQHTSGCNPCLAELTKYDHNLKFLKWWKYGNWTALAGALVIGLTGDNHVSNDSDFRVYGFAGLLLGGLSSELYRLSRVSKNEARLENVVEKYNKFKY
jgi:hypothetical protein